MTILLDLFKEPTRAAAKPRNKGITHVMDKGMALADLSSMMEVGENYVDIVKLGWCTSVLTQNLEKKLAFFKNRPVAVCCGGSLIELAIAHGKVRELVAFFKDQDFKMVEVSDGTVDYPRREKLKYIEMLAKDFTVLSEVGQKDRRRTLRLSQWVEQMSEDLSAGAWKVIAEGRESGTIGLFNDDGSVQTALVEEIADKIGLDNLIFEAPQKDQQVWMVRHFGANVNLGNIAPHDVISLETIRQKMRGDTMPQFVIAKQKAVASSRRVGPHAVRVSRARPSARPAKRAA
jgi:phosphosulfolactate synthase